MSDNKYYTTRFSFDTDREKVWKEIVVYLQRYIPRDSIVLDLGAGYCSFINNIKAKEKYALDLYREFTKYALNDVKAFVSNCTDLKKFKNNNFDVVFLSNLLEHLSIEEAESTLNEIYRVLKPKGKVILIQPNFKYSHKTYFDDYTHKTIYTDISLADLLKKHKFNIIKQDGKFLPFSLKSRLPKSGFLVRIYLRMPYRPMAKQMLIIGEKVD